jgi:hypothetical protein
MVSGPDCQSIRYRKVVHNYDNSGSVGENIIVVIVDNFSVANALTIWPRYHLSNCIIAFASVMTAFKNFTPMRRPKKQVLLLK